MSFMIASASDLYLQLFCVLRNNGVKEGPYCYVSSKEYYLQVKNAVRSTVRL